MAYYIYHIPGIKIGCAESIEDRVIKAQGYTECEILEVHEDVYQAAKREKELQKKYSYRIDGGDYVHMKKMAHLSGTISYLNKKGIHNLETNSYYASLGGKAQGPIQGAKNKESGHIQALGKKLSEYNNRVQTCPYCGIESRGLGYVRWHGDKCKHKK